MLRNLSLAVTAATLLLAPAAAQGATLTRSGDTYTLTAAPGEKNDLRMRAEFDPSSSQGPKWQVSISDDLPITNSAAGCEELVSNDFYVCDFGTDPNRKPTVVADAGDGDDMIILSTTATANVARGGPGNDQLYSAGGADTLDGGDGDDELNPEDLYSSILEPDTKGPDTVMGGPGVDTVAYRDGPAITLSLDGQPGDTSDGDNVMPDIEKVIGSDNNDVITATAGPNVIEGRNGNDTINGLGGDDELSGNDGNDTLDGGDGNDTLTGGSEDDRLVGGAGTDSFSGDFSGSFNQIVVGNDRIEARDGIAESISCGPGSDVAVVDAADIPATDPQNACETVDKGVAPPPPPGGGGTAAAGLGVRSTTLRYRDGRIKLTLRCAGTATCRGALSIRTRGSRPRTIASGRYAVSGGRTRTLTFKVGTSGKRTIGRKRSLKVSVRVVKAGQSQAVAKALTLRR